MLFKVIYSTETEHLVNYIYSTETEHLVNYIIQLYITNKTERSRGGTLRNLRIE